MVAFKESLRPSIHFRDYLQRALTRWPTLAPALRTLQAGGLCEGMPTEVLVAFTAPATQRDNTAMAPHATIAFAEIGWYQITAGSAARDANGIAHGPWPKTEPDGQPNDWLQLHDAARVVHALGRKATLAPSAWMGATDDQHALGLASIEDYYRQCNAKQEPELRASSIATAWGSWLAFMAFSAGPAGAEVVDDPWKAELAAVPEHLRPSALVHLAAAAIQARTWKRAGSPLRHTNPAHRIVRTWQKFRFAEEIGRALAAEAGCKPDVFRLRLLGQEAAHEDVLVREDAHERSDATIRPINFAAIAAGEAAGKELAS